MSYNIELCMKVNEKIWIEKLRNGEACFNSIDYFIKKSEDKGNDEQGDKFEGIFGRIKKTDHRFTMLKEQLGNDLETIDDGDYIILRRISARSIPIFCMYGILREDIHIKPESVCLENGEYIGYARYDFPEKIYKEFLDSGSNDLWGFYCSAGHLHNELDKSLQNKNIKFKKVKIKYDIDLTKEFLLELNKNYSEVSHKRIDLIYQHEIRYYLLDFTPKNPYILNYDPLSNNSCGIAPKELYATIKCKCVPFEE